jgi:hypothetical protein
MASMQMLAICVLARDPATKRMNASVSASVSASTSAPMNEPELVTAP